MITEHRGVHFNGLISHLDRSLGIIPNRRINHQIAKKQHDSYEVTTSFSASQPLSGFCRPNFAISPLLMPALSPRTLFSFLEVEDKHCSCHSYLVENELIRLDPKHTCTTPMEEKQRLIFSYLSVFTSINFCHP